MLLLNKEFFSNGNHTGRYKANNQFLYKNNAKPREQIGYATDFIRSLPKIIAMFLLGVYNKTLAAGKSPSTPNPNIMLNKEEGEGLRAGGITRAAV